MQLMQLMQLMQPMRTDTKGIEPKLLRIIDQAKQQPLESSLEPGVLQQGGMVVRAADAPL